MCPQPRPSAKVRLFCVPFAGGGASMYHSWGKSLPALIEVIGVQPPGREARLREPPYTACDTLVAALFAEISPLVDRPYALFGYSMGATIAFELARALRGSGLRSPLTLFTAARIAPQHSNRYPPLGHLPDEELIAGLRANFGVFSAALDDEELRAVVMPGLRADLRLCDTYEYQDALPLECPIHVFSATDDEQTPRALMDDWQAQTIAGFRHDELEGGHFFLVKDPTLVQRTLAATLCD